ncbi:hypothetical protein RJT34_20607 [Clitoria ternatea]|uniref:C2H2-type domain-containing protein n=1 Tax=Clitoria ternatea TaxID=43366 RepID=A0AAN9IT45_CLITE
MLRGAEEEEASCHQGQDNNIIERESKRVKVHVISKGKKELSCKFCGKKFTNRQALGGHQNAHKEERELVKKEKILSMASAYKNSRSSTLVNYSNLRSSSRHQVLNHHQPIIPQFQSLLLSLGPPNSKLQSQILHPRLGFINDTFGQASKSLSITHDAPERPTAVAKPLFDTGIFVQVPNSSSLELQNAAIQRIDLNSKPLEELDLKLRL